jgi:anti-sigma factor RsiW
MFMAGSIPSEQLQLLIAGYVLGDLDPEEATEFERLLADNPAIANEVARFQQTLELAYAPPEESPPAHLRSNILDAYRMARQDSEQQTATSRPRRPTISWGRLGGAVAAALIVGLSINNYRLWRALQATRIERAELQTLVYALTTTDTSGDATASIVVNPNTLEATIQVENLPPLPPDQVYVLWTVLQQGAPFTVDEKGAILTDVFQVDEQGEIVQTVPVPRVYRSQEFIDKLAITREDAESPQLHQGSPILISEF